MGILRSEELRRGTLIIPSERARGYIDVIGHQLNMQFEDMNVANDQRRPFRRYIQRIDEVERMIRILADDIKAISDISLVRSRHESFLQRECKYRFDEIENEIKKRYEHADDLP